MSSNESRVGICQRLRSRTRPLTSTVVSYQESNNDTEGEWEGDVVQYSDTSPLNATTNTNTPTRLLLSPTQLDVNSTPLLSSSSQLTQLDVNSTPLLSSSSQFTQLDVNSTPLSSTQLDDNTSPLSSSPTPLSSSPTPLSSSPPHTTSQLDDATSSAAPPPPPTAPPLPPTALHGSTPSAPPLAPAAAPPRAPAAAPPLPPCTADTPCVTSPLRVTQRVTARKRSNPVTTSSVSSSACKSSIAAQRKMRKLNASVPTLGDLWHKVSCCTVDITVSICI